ncbi:MAG: T9SS type A sorting domain-containing protein [Candidatus Cloacimonetes bacterium]|nr:T9SS type A sorting domain-containing protein [Candidatus Cloacimonadota bacterium]
MRRLTILAFLLLTAAVLGAATLTFEPPTIEYRDGFALVTMPGAAPWGEPGQPLLPAVGYQYLLPWGEDATDVLVEHGEAVRIALDAPLYPVQRQYPISQLEQIAPALTTPDAAAYATERWPLADHAALKTGVFRGYRIASMVLFPVVYLPGEQALLYYPELTVNVQTQVLTVATASDAFVRDDDDTMRRLSRLVDNPSSAWTYPVPQQGRTRDIAEYVIITDDDYVDEFQLLADYKNSLGIVTSIVTVDYITANFTGQDTQDMIRNFIIDAYQNNGLCYVLLAGDDEIIPHRGFYVDPGYSYDDDDIGSDLYYFGLDGNWNDDGDNYWGEWYEADFFADVYGGRAPVDNSTEAQNFVNKQLMYQQTPVESELTEYMLVGEDLGWQSCGMDYMEEIRLGSSSHGYTTVAIPDHINVTTMYDEQGIWSTSQLFSAFNAGKNLVGHLGHCSVHYNLKFHTPSVNTSTFTNNGVNHNFYIVTTQGCYCNSFDNRNSYHQVSTEDCIAEQWTLLSTGPVCYIGNTRYGWGDGSGTNGAGQHLQREFYDALFDENINIISEAHEDSRCDTEPFLTADTVLLWTYYECTLLGDPTLDIWSDQPQAVALVAPSVLPVGSDEILVSATSAGAEVEGMRVSAIFAGEVLATGLLDDNGVAVLGFASIAVPGDLEIVLVGHNIHDTQQTVEVISPDNAYIIPDQMEVSDGGDNLAAWNETLDLHVVAENVGNEPSENLTATLSTDCEYIDITIATLDYGSVAAQATAEADSDFVFTTAPDFPVETVAVFTLDFTAGEETWSYDWSIPLYAPLLALEGDSWTELTGNGNGAPDPGETLQPLMMVYNESGVTLESLTMELTCDNPLVSVGPASLEFNNIESGGLVMLSDFTVEIDETVEPLSTLHFYLHLETDRGHMYDQIICVGIEVLADNFESAQTTTNWTHQVVEPGWIDQWHHSSQDNHTAGGGWSWKCGSSATSNYLNNIYAALESQPFVVPDLALLTFWHWMDAEDSGNYPGYAYDGGFVELSTDGGDTWQQITPVDGYPYLSRGDNTPLDPSTPMWSGQMDWSQAWFDLDAYGGGEVMIRFVFASDTAETMVGWFVDDVRVMREQPLAPPVNLAVELIEGMGHISWQGPNGPAEYYVVQRDGEVVAEQVFANWCDDDMSGLPAGSYSYTVATWFDGELSEYSEPVILNYLSTDGEGAPGLITELRGNHPNPFNPTTTISYSVATPQRVSLKVYNVRGQLVRTLQSQPVEAGEHSVLWRGDDDHGRPVATGLYFVRLQAGSHSFTRKMLLLK